MTEKHVPEKKLKAVKELADLLKNKKTFLIASIKNLPASQFQEIGKKLRGKAIVKVPKKSLISRAIDEVGMEKAGDLKNEITEDTALLFSDIDSFELASELLENKSPAKGKVGQTALEDIQVEAGPTDLVPGPAISELGALGIQIQIEGGKITIKTPKIIVKKGEKLSEGAASLMNKLDIKPFSIGFVPISAYDIQSGKLYLNIEIDKEGTLENLKYSFGKALSFAVEIGLMNQDTVKVLLSRASAHANKINRIMTGEPEPVIENPMEEVKEIKEEKEEPKASAAEGLAGLFG
jgi:large subunit ribosomal protein L10